MIVALSSIAITASVNPSFSSRVLSPATVLQDDRAPWRLLIAGGEIAAGAAEDSGDGWMEIDTRNGPVSIRGEDVDGTWTMDIRPSFIEVLRSMEPARAGATEIVSFL